MTPAPPCAACNPRIRTVKNDLLRQLHHGSAILGLQVESILQTLCEETEIAELELKVRQLGA
jgi:hypothetical protein